MTLHKSLSPFNNRNTRIDAQTPITLNDCTLREGEQSAIVNFQPKQKVWIAHRLAEAGLKQIQVGYPGLSESDRYIIRELRNSGITCELEAVVLSYLDSWDEQLDAAAASGATMVNIVHVPSPPRREKIFRVSKEQIQERSEAAIRRGKENGLFVTYCPADTTRTELDFVLELVRLADRSGADRVSIADTLGAATPGAVSFLFAQVRQVTALPLAFHNHNDFGLAIANALAAIEAGAESIDTTLNGWGDRTGNPPTEEIATILGFLYGSATDMDIPGLVALSKEVAADLEVAVPLTKPLSGSVAFAHKLETHVKAVLGHPPAFEPFDPGLVGGSRHVALGQYSGPEAVRARFQALGIDCDDVTLQEAAAQVQSRARSSNRALSDDDLREIAAHFNLVS